MSASSRDVLTKALAQIVLSSGFDLVRMGCTQGCGGRVGSCFWSDDEINYRCEITCNLASQTRMGSLELLAAVTEAYVHQLGRTSMEYANHCEGFACF